MGEACCCHPSCAQLRDSEHKLPMSGSSSGAVGAPKGIRLALSIEHRAGPYRAGSVATQSGLVLPPETRDTGALALCPGALCSTVH